MTVEITLKKDFIKDKNGPTWFNGGLIGHIQNVERVRSEDGCTFFYDGNDNLIAGFGSYIEHDFKTKEVKGDWSRLDKDMGLGKTISALQIAPSYCLKCGEPLTSDDFKNDGAGQTGMHLECLDEANEELQYRVSSERIPEDE